MENLLDCTKYSHAVYAGVGLLTNVLVAAKDSHSYKTGMRGTVMFRPTVAYIECRAVGIQ